MSKNDEKSILIISATQNEREVPPTLWYTGVETLIRWDTFIFCRHSCLQALALIKKLKNMNISIFFCKISRPICVNKWLKNFSPGRISGNQIFSSSKLSYRHTSSLVSGRAVHSGKTFICSRCFWRKKIIPMTYFRPMKWTKPYRTTAQLGGRRII